MTTEEITALLVEESKPSLRKLLKPTEPKVLRITSDSWKARHTVKRLHRELLKREAQGLTEPKMILFIDSTTLIAALQRRGTKRSQCIAALDYLFQHGERSGITVVMRVQELEPEGGKFKLPDHQPVGILGTTGSGKGTPLSKVRGEEQPSQACLGMGHRFDLSPKPVPKIEMWVMNPMDTSVMRPLHHSIIARTGNGRGGPVR
ncbi:MAG: hypothetical protein ACTH30_10565 [Leucobacter sp.]